MKLTQAFQKEDRILAREVQANKKVDLKSSYFLILKSLYLLLKMHIDCSLLLSSLLILI